MRFNQLKKGCALKVEKLLVAPTDIFFPDGTCEKSRAVPPEQQSSLTIGALRYIGTKISARLGAAPQHPTDRIFLSRRKSTWASIGR